MLKLVKKVNGNNEERGVLRWPADDIFPDIHIAKIGAKRQSHNDIGHTQLKI
jgi:hypothetical protein